MAPDISKHDGQTVVVSFFRFHSSKRIWAMRQMALVPALMRKPGGPSFFKVLGTGGGFGYSIKPDFRTYALLSVWDSREEAEGFESDSKVMKRYRSKTLHVYSLFLNPLQSRGAWSGVNPFRPSASEGKQSGKGIVVLTRATLKLRYTLPFWKRVKGVSSDHERYPEVIFTKGVGEFPWMTQATFSVWENIEKMMEFAYGEGGKHKEAISTTRRLKGFREELYARFQLLSSKGSWLNGDPIADAGLLQ